MRLGAENGGGGAATASSGKFTSKLFLNCDGVAGSEQHASRHGALTLFGPPTSGTISRVRLGAENGGGGAATVAGRSQLWQNSSERSRSSVVSRSNLFFTGVGQKFPSLRDDGVGRAVFRGSSNSGSSTAPTDLPKKGMSSMARKLLFGWSFLFGQLRATWFFSPHSQHLRSLRSTAGCGHFSSGCVWPQLAHFRGLRGSRSSRWWTFASRRRLRSFAFSRPGGVRLWNRFTAATKSSMELTMMGPSSSSRSSHLPAISSGFSSSTLLTPPRFRLKRILADWVKIMSRNSM